MSGGHQVIHIDIRESLHLCGDIEPQRLSGSGRPSGQDHQGENQEGEEYLQNNGCIVFCAVSLSFQADGFHIRYARLPVSAGDTRQPGHSFFIAAVFLHFPFTLGCTRETETKGVTIDNICDIHFWQAEAFPSTIMIQGERNILAGNIKEV